MLFAKLLLTPALIAVVTLAGRRWGPRASGLLVGLPLTSGPVVLFLAIEQGTCFATAAAEGTLAGLLSLAGFSLVYSTIATRAGWLASTVGGWVAFIVITWFLLDRSIPLGPVFLLVVGSLSAVLALLPEPQIVATSELEPRWDLPLRVAAATGMVLGLTYLARLLGPRLAGLITPFPVYATVVTAFTHRLQGGGAAVEVLRGVVASSFTFAFFFLSLAATMVSWGLGPAFGLAVLAGAIVQVTALRIRKKLE